MCDFSDREDQILVALAREYEDQNKQVSWAALSNAMKYTKKDARALKRRLTTLKNTHGKLLRAFPCRYFKTRIQPIQSKAKKPIFILPSHSATKLVVEHILDQSSLATNHHPLSPSPPFTLADVEPFSQEQEPNKLLDTASTVRLDPLTAIESEQAVASIFATIIESDIRQAAGRTEYNAGEMSTSGVTCLIDRCQLQHQDVFIDIGSGIGNVIAQVVLQSCVAQTIGIEIRTDVASLGSAAITNATHQYPRLAQAINQEGDVIELAKEWSFVICSTVLYANNFVFTPEANLALQHLCCVLPALRMIALVARVCPRHQTRCTKEFCMLWCEDAEPLTVRTEYRHRPVALYVYTRRR